MSIRSASSTPTILDTDYNGAPKLFDNAFPSNPITGTLIYRYDLGDWYAYDGAAWFVIETAAKLLDFKASVRLATTAALAANTYAAGVKTANANGAMGTIDGVAGVVADRVLVKDEGTGAENGIYTITDLGSASTPFILTRAIDADASAEVTSGMYVYVEEGTANQKTAWVLSTANPITLDTTALTFTEFGVSISYALVGAITTIQPDDAAAAGTANTAARGDHKHAIVAAAPTATGVATAAAEGAATSFARSDHAHQSNTAPTTIAPDDAAAIGTSGEPARADHTHAIVAAAPGATGVATASAEGVATSFARSDHAHQSNTAPAAVGVAAVIGTSGEPARADHVHVAVGRLLSTTTLTSASANHTTSANTNKIMVRLQAGGGGGGGVDTAAASGGAGGGGGAGGYAEKLFSVSPSTAYAYTCGAAGVAGANTGGTGGTGGDSTFIVGGTTVTAKGGLGGVGMANGTTPLSALGGAPSPISTNGDFNGSGAPGGWSYRSTGLISTSGNGGSCAFGSGGAAFITLHNGAPGNGFGGGGSGGNNINNGGAVTGGAGLAGCIIVEEYS